MQDNRIDAFFYTVGHPADTIHEATTGVRKVLIADITGLDSLLENFPYYGRASIPVKYYPTALNTNDIESFNVKATFITSARLPDDIAYAITKEVFDNIENFKKLHPAYAHLTREGMLTHLSAPLHPGAMRYFKESGLK